MTSTGPANVVMSACDRIAPGRLALARPGSREPRFGWPARREPAFARAEFPTSASCQPAHYRLHRPIWSDPVGLPAIAASARPTGAPPAPAVSAVACVRASALLVPAQVAYGTTLWMVI